MVFAKATTFAEHEEQSVAYWRAVDPSLKFQAIVELVQDSCYLSGGDGPGSGPARLAHGVEKLGS